jgi:hypothetical protein
MFKEFKCCRLLNRMCFRVSIDCRGAHMWPRPRRSSSSLFMRTASLFIVWILFSCARMADVALCETKHETQRENQQTSSAQGEGTRLAGSGSRKGEAVSSGSARNLLQIKKTYRGTTLPQAPPPMGMPEYPPPPHRAWQMNYRLLIIFGKIPNFNIRLPTGELTRFEPLDT